ncbi:hypothetical protein DINM_006986 [Dirofilaria immitis]|nr:hypothetical protein [Dirofilaria immitis]
MKNQINSIGLFHSVEAIYTGGAIQWSLDGKTLFSACGNYIRASNVDDGKQSLRISSQSLEIADIVDNLQDWKRGGSVKNINFLLNKDCNSAVVAYTNGLLRNYRLLPSLENGSEVVNPEIIRQWKSTHAAPVLVMKFSKDDILLATGSADFVVKVWNLEERSCVGSLKSTSAVSAIEFLDKSRIVIGCTDGSSSLFCLGSMKKLVFRWTNHTSQIVSIIIGQLPTVAFVSRDQTLSIVNVDSHEKMKVLPYMNPSKQQFLRLDRCSQSRIDSIIYNQICKKFLLATSDFNVFGSMRKLSKLNGSLLVSMMKYLIYVFGPKLKYLIAATNSSELRFMIQIPGHTDSVLSLSTPLWDPMLFASSSKDNTFIIWHVDFNDGEEMKVEKPPGILIMSRVFGFPTAPSIVSLFHLKLQSSATFVAHAKDITCLDISLNDRLCVTGSMDKTAKLWHIDTNKMHFTIGGMLNGHRRGVWDARFSPTTQAVITCSGDCMIRIFSLPNRDCIATLAGHSSAVLNGAIVNSGKQIISVDSGGLLKIWDIAANECITTVDAHDEKIWALQVASDESRFATEEERSRAQKTHNEQILANLMQQNRYAEALSFSLTLARPYSCLKIVQGMMELESNELHDAIGKLRKEELLVLLNFATQWNTNSRTADALRSVERARQNAAFLDYTLAQMSLSNL